jgi:hypothetical protein
VLSVNLDWDPGEHQQIQHGDSDGSCLDSLDMIVVRCALTSSRKMVSLRVPEVYPCVSFYVFALHTVLF